MQPKLSSIEKSSTLILIAKMWCCLPGNYIYFIPIRYKFLKYCIILNDFIGSDFQYFLKWRNQYFDCRKKKRDWMVFHFKEFLCYFHEVQHLLLYTSVCTVTVSGLQKRWCHETVPFFYVTDAIKCELISIIGLSNSYLQLNNGRFR